VKFQSIVNHRVRRSMDAAQIESEQTEPDETGSDRQSAHSGPWISGGLIVIALASTIEPNSQPERRG
jgi:hypothetical protein